MGNTKGHHKACPECDGAGGTCWACLGTGLNDPRLAVPPECIEEGCEAKAYKDSEYCRAHASEIRMFGHTRFEIERTAKTKASDRHTGEYSKSPRELKLASKKMMINHYKERRRKKADCLTDGCNSKVLYEGARCYSCRFSQPDEVKARLELAEAIKNLNERKK